MNTIEIMDKNVINQLLTRINAINDYMKKIYNNTKGYYCEELYAYSFDNEQIPRTVTHTFDIQSMTKNKRELIEDYLPYLKYYVNDPKSLYMFIRDYKKDIDTILIDDIGTHIIYNKLIYTLRRYKTVNKDPLENDLELISEFEINSEEEIDKFSKLKGIFNLYIDIDKENIRINEIPDEEDNYIKLVISHKYLTGFSKLKIKKASLGFQIYATSIENVYLVNIIVSDNSIRTENLITVMDY